MYNYDEEQMKKIRNCTRLKEDVDEILSYSICEIFSLTVEKRKVQDRATLKKLIITIFNFVLSILPLVLFNVFSSATALIAFAGYYFSLNFALSFQLRDKINDKVEIDLLEIDSEITDKEELVNMLIEKNEQIDNIITESMDNIIKNKQEYTEDCEFPLVFAEDYSVKTKVLRR